MSKDTFWGADGVGTTGLVDSEDDDDRCGVGQRHAGPPTRSFGQGRRAIAVDHPHRQSAERQQLQSAH